MKHTSIRVRFTRHFLISMVALVMAATGCFEDSNRNLLPFASLNSSESGSGIGSKGDSAFLPGESGDGVYLIGAGMHDITGPAAEVGMMGFADMDQKTSGIHMRLRSRAFIVGDKNQRVVFVSADLGQLFQMVKMKVCEKVAANPALASYYNEKNILVSATHTHSGPGGYSGYFLYDFTVLGFIKQNFNAIVDGIYLSILKAHDNLAPGRILINEGSLEGCGGNRSRFAYENNPAEERALYDGDTDTSFTLLKFMTLDGEEIGMVNWFALHPTSIGPENTLISGDHKGYASYLFEKEKGADYASPRTFVAAFAQSNSGDVSPNSDFGQAPPHVDFEHNPSLENATLRQYGKAKELYDGAVEELRGPVDFRHRFVDMSGLAVEDLGCTTCPAAMGASFSAGSVTDNPSPAPLFPAGTTVESLNWSDNAALAFLHTFLGGVFAPFWPKTQDPAYRACHAEKPILLPTGVASINVDGIPMTPRVVPLQVIRIGGLAIVAVPSEVTTMAGRRIRNAVVAALAPAGVTHVVVAALANTYVSYLATREEYAMQSYEGACTQFGPNELAAFQQEYDSLCSAMLTGSDVEPGPTPRDVTGDTVNFQTGVVLDDKPLDREFGDVIAEPAEEYRRGDTVSVQFWGGHPKNDLQIQGSFLTVERVLGERVDEVCVMEGWWIFKKRVCRQVVSYETEPAARDWDPETVYRWERDGASYSKITVTWNTKNAAPGYYRVRHNGHWKSGWTGAVSPYQGISRIFRVN
ncbi:MAG: neutral/alkaline ceramidase [Spirochaetes bacterium]|nr:neutral/alkaline ceramidase [Spirochaetota bacterium]